MSKSDAPPFQSHPVGNDNSILNSIRMVLKDRIDQEEKVEQVLADIATVISNVVQPSKPEIPSVDSHVLALQSTVKFLEESNQRIATEHSRLWNAPHKAFNAFTVVLGVVAVIASFKLFVDWGATSAITSEAAKQKEALDSAILRVEDRGRTIESEIRSRLDAFSTEREQLSNKVNQLSESITAKISAAESKHQRAINATSVAHRVLSLVALGRDQLVYHQNPNRAKFYAAKAMTELDAEIASCRDLPQLVTTLKRLQSSIWVLQAECEFQLLRMDDLEEVAQKITSSDCQCLEGNYYYGLAKLALAVDQANDASRKLHTDAAVVSFNRNVADGEHGHLSFLYLSAAQVLAGRYQTARDDAVEFLKSLPESKEDRVRLSDELRAQITIAIAWRNVADFLDGNQKALENHDASCSVDRSALPRSDAIMFERVFDRIIQERKLLTKSEESSDALGLYCAAMIGQLRRSHLAAASGGCAAGVDPFPADILAKYEIVRSDIPFSTDKSLGKPSGDRLIMRYITYHWAKETRTRTTPNGEETYTVQVPVTVTKEESFPAKEDLPPRRYVPYEAPEAPEPSAAPVPPASLM